MRDVEAVNRQFDGFFDKVDIRCNKRKIASISYPEKRNHSDRENILKSFLLAKRLEGCSMETLDRYYGVIINYAKSLDKSVCDVSSSEIREYLLNYQERNRVSNRTLDSMRLVLSSFYNWMEEEGLVKKNPVKKIHRIKYDEIIKKPFTDEEVERLKLACKTNRERAIVSFLATSGVRCSELVQLNKSDINMSERECVVFGKGAKERTVYFDIRTKIYLEKYLLERDDDEEALFVSCCNGRCERISKEGLEYVIHQIGVRSGVENVHPHRFRRTLATKLIDRGVPIEQVQRILGHSKIETTLIYAQVNQKNVKTSHSRYI